MQLRDLGVGKAGEQLIVGCARDGVEFVAQCLACGGEFYPRVAAVCSGPVPPDQAEFLQSVQLAGQKQSRSCAPTCGS